MRIRFCFFFFGGGVYASTYVSIARKRRHSIDNCAGFYQPFSGGHTFEYLELYTSSSKPCLRSLDQPQNPKTLRPVVELMFELRQATGAESLQLRDRELD